MMRWLTKWWLNAVANVALFMGRKPRALEVYQQIVRIDPADEVARATVGNLLVELGDVPGAIDQFLLLLEHNPNNADAWFNLGYLYEQRDCLVDAERCFRRAIELQASLDRAWYGLGLVLIREERLTEAVAVLRKNTELQPFSPYGWYQLAMTYHHLGDSGQAWRTQQHLQSFEPKFAAGLKKDLESTVSRSRTQPAAAAPPASLDPPQHSKEAAPATP